MKFVNEELQHPHEVGELVDAFSADFPVFLRVNYDPLFREYEFRFHMESESVDEISYELDSPDGKFWRAISAAQDQGASISFRFSRIAANTLNQAELCDLSVARSFIFHTGS